MSAATKPRAIVAPYRVVLTRRMAEAIRALDHHDTRVAELTVSRWPNTHVLICPDPDGFVAAVDGLREGSLAGGLNHAARDVAGRVREFRRAHPQEQIR